MDRRRFLKSVGKMLGAAAAAPLAPITIPKRGWYADPSPKILAAREEIIWSALPSDLTVPPAMFRWLQYLREETEQQIGIQDVAALRKMKISS